MPRILMVHRYFHPDAPPYATMLRAIAHQLASDGHDVRVLSAMPTYNVVTAAMGAPRVEDDHGVRVRRLRLPREDKAKPFRRTLIAGLFLGGAFVGILRERPDLVTFSTMPPVGLGLVVRGALRLLGRPGRYVYHCQDLYPEAATVGRSSGKPSLMERIAGRLERGTRRGAAAVVVLSTDMADTVVAGGARADRVHVINNFSLVEAPPGRPERPDGPPRVVFAGNLGRFQGLETVAHAVELLRAVGAGHEFLFLGDGPGRPVLEAVDGPDVTLAGYVPPATAFRRILACDVGLVTLRPDLLDVAYPSKTMTYLAAGCRLVVAAEPDSEIARMVVAEDVGVVAPPDDASALAEAIRKATATTRPEAARHAQSVGERLFGREAVLRRWSQLVATVVATPDG